MVYIPLSDASFTEVLARVAFQLIKLDYARWRECYTDPDTGMVGLSAALRQDGFEVMATWVYAYAKQWTPFTPVGLIRERMVFQSRCGVSWRRIVYPAYKETRRANPRVTNRGVSSPRQPRDEQ